MELSLKERSQYPTYTAENRARDIGPVLGI